MKFKIWLEHKNYPVVQGNTWQGLQLIPVGSSWNSVGASLGDDYTVLPGVHDIPFSEFKDIKNFFYATNDWDKSAKLATLIANNKKIEPLLIVVDKEPGPYILEGGHRFVALHKLGFKSIPAVIIVDEN